MAKTLIEQLRVLKNIEIAETKEMNSKYPDCEPIRLGFKELQDLILTRFAQHQEHLDENERPDFTDPEIQQVQKAIKKASRRGIL